MKIWGIFILLFLMGCHGYKQGAKVGTWVPISYELCDPHIVTNELPFDIAINVLHVNIPTNRYDNINSARPYIVYQDGSYEDVGSQLVEFWGQTHIGIGEWSQDGKFLYMNKIWEDPQNGLWEQAAKQFILSSDSYLTDVYKLDVSKKTTVNLTETNRVSFWNTGVTNFPLDPTKVAFNVLTPSGESKTYTMNTDGSNKQPLTSAPGFSYGFHLSNDGTKYAFHSEYKIYIGDMDTKTEIRVNTPCSFNFGPTWSPDSQHIVFFCGASNKGPDIYIADRDGNNVSLLATRDGYSGSVPVLDSYDYHEGSTDNIAWSDDSKYLVYAAQIGGKIELFKIDIETKEKQQLTFTSAGTLNYYPNISGNWLLFNSDRTGKRNTFIMNLESLKTRQITSVDKECGVYTIKIRPN